MKRWLLPAALAVALGWPAGAEEVDEALTREICAVCHEEAETFAAGPHGRAMAAVDPALLERSCATCHQPSADHPEDPMPENVVRVPGPEACADCHPDSSARLSLATPAHARHGTVCLDCHASGHADPGTDYLLAAMPFRLCGDCHRQQASAAYQPFAHREGSEPFACTQCHAVHATGRLGRLLGLGNGGACLECHTGQRGPFVFPHPPQALDGCTECHQPHGSANPRLLTRRTVLNLCLECHPGVPAFHDLTRARFRACQSCHVAVHGSNRDHRLFDE